MELKEFLQSKFDKSNFIKFISDRFYGFSQNFIDDEYLGKVKLDDKSEIGFFIFEVKENKDIQNSRVGFHNELKTYANNLMLDGAIGAFYHKDQKAWRLSFIRFSYDDKNKKICTNQKRFTFVLGSHKVKTAYKQLRTIRYPKIIELEQVFGVEAITKDFYKGLVKEYEKLLNQYLTYPNLYDNNNKYENSKKEFTIRLIGRILFIKFLNKKSLVPDNIFEITNDYYHEKLEPLFFEQLNTPKSERKKEFENDTIPFLNGGLFEPLENLDYYEWDGLHNADINILKIDDKFFTGLYEHLNQYNFTIDENSLEDNELSIDPEMLGRIFENLLAEINPETSQNARKSTGSYYTPREIVEYMVSSSLLEYLKTKTNVDEEVLKNIIFKNEEPKNDYDKTKILSAIFELKILDPACGSGAFPMGLLQKIVKILNLIDDDATIWFELQKKEFKEIHRNRNKDYIRKLSIIKNTIYGVDIQPIAIEITKLRFFLSLVVDEEGEPEPLPNLEFKFVCADSLLPFPFAKQKMQQTTIFDNTDNLNNIHDEIKFIKERYFESASSNKKLLRNMYKEAQEKLLYEIKALGEGDMSLVDYDPFDPLNAALFFDTKFMFDLNDGFDIVIGNPPYIDSESMTKNKLEYREKLKNIYTTAKGNWDIFVVFIEQSTILAKKKGVISLIVPNKLISAKYTLDLRAFIQTYNLLELIDYSSVNVFSEADVYPVVFQILKDQNSHKPISIKIMEDLNKYKSKSHIQYEQFNTDIFWDKYFFSNDILNVISKISQFKSIKDYNFNVLGAATVNEAYLIKEVLKELDKDSKNYFKFINTGTIDPYISLWGHKNTQYIKDAYNHPIIEETDLKKINIVRYEQSILPKIIIAGMSLNIEAYYDYGEYLAGKSTTIIIGSENLKILTAILNSKVVSFWFSKYYNSLSMSGGYFNVGKNEINSIPIPNIQYLELDFLNILVDYVIFLKQRENQENKKFITSFFERVIDVAVYELYFPDELYSHNYGVLNILENEKFPTDITMEIIESIYQKWSDRDHKIAYNVHFIDSLETIKIIEGKVK